MTERKTAIITGAASGIGLATTRRFSEDSRYNPIYAVDKDPRVPTVFPANEYPNVICLQVDVRSENQILEMLRKAVDDSGRINVIVNAAGVISAGRRRTYYEGNGNLKPELKEMDEVNVKAPLMIIASAPAIMKENGGGTIIIVSSSKQFFPDMYRGWYMSGKKSVSRVIKGCAEKWRRDYNVRLVDVQPGNTKTNIDRKVWTNGNNESEMECVQGLNDWWRNHFGNDPKKVAEVIYRIAEGKIKHSPVMVGRDAKLGAFLQMYLPIPTLRWNMIFFILSSGIYRAARLHKLIKRK